jgi:osmotically-inducible protein OsmY
MNEHKEDVARRLSDKVQLDSENYQVMNYGIGGTISGHVDSPGQIKAISSTK